MTKVLAGITTSVDGYVAGPKDGPGKGSESAASASTTGCSAARGATTASRAGSRQARTRS